MNRYEPIRTNDELITIRRYRNRQIGNILKELKLTEGNEHRTAMRVTLPVHELFLKQENDAIGKEMNAEMNAGITPKQLTTYRYIKNNPATSYRQMAKDLSIPESTLQRYIRILKAKNLIAYEGPKKGGQWKILDQKN